MRILFATVWAALLALAPLPAISAEPKIVRIANLGPNSLNPLLSSSVTENALAPIAFDLLIGVDEHGNPLPRLAAEVPSLQNGGISKDGLSITYRLRRNVRWHDGAPFTSKDVAFSWSAVMNPRNNVISRRGYDLVRRVDTPDAYTAIFRLKERFAPAILTLFSESDQPYRIVPEHILAREPDFNRAAFNQHPIGTGPFKFVRWDRGERIEYEANHDYYLGPPKLDGVVVREIIDQNTMVIQMRTHAVDFMTAGSAAYRDLRALPDIKTELVDVNAYVALAFNLTRPILRDIAVRRAIAVAIDKSSIVEKVTFGTGTPASADLGPFMWAYDPAVKTYPFDPAAARSMLEAAGWIAGKDGVRSKEGVRLSLTLLEGAASSTGRAIDVQVQSMLQAVGFDLQIRTVASQLLAAPVSQGGFLRAGNFDIVSWSWIAGWDPDNSSQFTCGAFPPAGENFWRYCSPAVDRAERTALASYDRAVRKRAYARIERQLSADLPMVFLYWPKQRLAYNPNLKGVRSNGTTETWNINEWSL